MTNRREEEWMAGYGRDFMGRVRGMWDRFAGERSEHRRPPMGATGPGGEGYFLSRDMARDADNAMDYSGRGWDDAGSRGFPAGGMAQFGRAGAGRGYGGDYRTGRGGYDAGEFFVNRHQGGDTGYRDAYQRDLGMRDGRGMAAGGWGYGSEYTYGGLARGDRGRQTPRTPRYGSDFRGRDAGMRGYDGGPYRGSQTPFPRTGRR
jgi:hypothetical protein